MQFSSNHTKVFSSFYNTPIRSFDKLTRTERLGRESIQVRFHMVSSQVFELIKYVQIMLTILHPRVIQVLTILSKFDKTTNILYFQFA